MEHLQKDTLIIAQKGKVQTCEKRCLQQLRETRTSVMQRTAAQTSGGMPTGPNLNCVSRLRHRSPSTEEPSFSTKRLIPCRMFEVTYTSPGHVATPHGCLRTSSACPYLRDIRVRRIPRTFGSAHAIAIDRARRY